jgi:hypothetical protein
MVFWVAPVEDGDQEWLSRHNSKSDNIKVAREQAKGLHFPPLIMLDMLSTQKANKGACELLSRQRKSGTS